MFATAAERGARTGQLPKGLTAETAALVERAVRDAEGDLGASECAEVVGLSRVSARRYLEHFVNAGLADVRLRYGSAGRPERRYRWR
jgi:response regulator of citrate/malate metabolism